jgi:hypothetical protein
VVVERLTAETTPFTAALDPEVGAIIHRACKDCHSNATTWPWYSRVAPVSWMIARDVSRGRAKLNFSEWGPGTRSANEVAEICDAVTDESMPLRPYLLMHPEARLSRQDVDTICAWADHAKARAGARAPARGKRRAGARRRDRVADGGGGAMAGER